MPTIGKNKLASGAPDSSNADVKVGTRLSKAGHDSWAGGTEGSSSSIEEFQRYKGEGAAPAERGTGADASIHGPKPGNLGAGEGDNGMFGKPKSPAKGDYGSHNSLKR